MKDNEEEPVMHSKSDNKEFMNCDNADEVVEELFQSLLNSYEIGLETSIKVSDLFFVVVVVFIYCITNVIK